MLQRLKHTFSKRQTTAPVSANVLMELHGHVIVTDGS